MELYCQSYLDQYDRDGVLHCECGREHRLHTRRILLGPGVMESMPSVLEEWYGSRARVWILSDENTEAAAGRRCKRLLSGFAVSGAVLPATPRPRTTLEAIRTLSEEAGKGYPDP